MLLPCAPASVPEARRRMTADLLAAGIFDRAIADAALVLSELLSNAIRHARPLSGSRLQVTWVLQGASVEVAVCDGGSMTRPHAEHAPVSSLGGRGLGIVEHLARTWGVRCDDLGVTVWAVLAAPRMNGAGTAPGPR
jgi:anti-sigma regulatory factor (Ser/Thr protein kinase)